MGIEARRHTLRLSRCVTRTAVVVSRSEASATFPTTNRREATARRAASRARVAERVCRCGAKRLPERGHAGRARRRATRSRPQKGRRPIERDLIGAWNVLGGQRNHVRTRSALTARRGRASERDDQPLHEVVKGESPLRRAERDTNHDFQCSRDRARQRQSGDVRAGDQEEHSRATISRRSVGLMSRRRDSADGGGGRVQRVDAGSSAAISAATR